ADRDDAVADVHLRRVAELDRLKVRDTFDLEQRDVVGDVVTDDVRGMRVAAATDVDLDVRRIRDHVVVGEHLTACGAHHAGSRSTTLCGRRRDVHDGGDHVAGD